MEWGINESLMGRDQSSKSQVADSWGEWEFVTDEGEPWNPSLTKIGSAERTINSSRPLFVCVCFVSLGLSH